MSAITNDEHGSQAIDVTGHTDRLLGRGRPQPRRYLQTPKTT